jgi:hypothetical protein
MFNNKSQIKIISLLFLSLSLLFIEAYSFSGSGSGTNIDPFEITTCTQLQEMENNLSSSYELLNDIDCVSITNFKRIGYCVGPCDGGGNELPFNGTFNGNENTISNLNIVNLTTTDEAWGLFGYVNNSLISEISLMNTNVNIPNANNIGGLIGYFTYSEISNSYSSFSNITGSNEVGGLIGDSRDSNISMTFSSNSIIYGSGSTIGGLVGGFVRSNLVKSYSSNSTISGFAFIGGLTARASDGSISDSYSSFSNITGGDDYVGGIAGDVYQAEISNSYSSFSNITGNNFVGGLTGYLSFGEISNSYSVSSNISGVGGVFVGGLIGYNGGTSEVINSSYHNTSDNPNVGIGFDDNAQTTYAQTDSNYYFNSSNFPLNNWDNTNIWYFSGDEMPTLDFPIISTPGGLSSLFPFGSLTVSFFLLLSFFLLS